MNPEKLKKVQSNVRIGGKGTPRRKKKVTRSVDSAREKRLQASLKRMALNTVADVQEANIFKDDGTVINIKKPEVQAEMPANVAIITGHAEKKSFVELLPNIANELGSDGIEGLNWSADRMENVQALIDVDREETTFQSSNENIQEEGAADEIEID